MQLSGVKMLPIMQFSDGSILNESLQIIKKLDRENTLSNEWAEQGIENLLSAIAKPVHNLAMPYWIFTNEFDPLSRDYFRKKKEAKRGPLQLLAQRKNEFLRELPALFLTFKDDLRPSYKHHQLSILDIMLASHLWGLYVVPEFQFPNWLHDYLQDIAVKCNFNYHIDFWQGPL